MNLDQKAAPPLLHQFRLGRTLLHLDAHLGIDVHTKQAAFIECLLQLRGVLLADGGFHGGTLVGGKRFADELGGLHHTAGLRFERLPFHAIHERQRGGELRKRSQRDKDESHRGQCLAELISLQFHSGSFAD